MTVVTIEEAKLRMDELALLAAGGESIRIAGDSGLMLELRPVPQVVHETGRARVGGQWAGLVEVGSEFFEPMPEDWLAEFYAGPVFPAEDSDAVHGADSQPK